MPLKPPHSWLAPACFSLLQKLAAHMQLTLPPAALCSLPHACSWPGWQLAWPGLACGQAGQEEEEVDRMERTGSSFLPCVQGRGMPLHCWRHEIGILTAAALCVCLSLFISSSSLLLLALAASCQQPLPVLFFSPFPAHHSLPTPPETWHA